MLFIGANSRKVLSNVHDANRFQWCHVVFNGIYSADTRADLLSSVFVGTCKTLIKGVSDYAPSFLDGVYSDNPNTKGREQMATQTIPLSQMLGKNGLSYRTHILMLSICLCGVKGIQKCERCRKLEDLGIDPKN